MRRIEQLIWKKSKAFLYSQCLSSVYLSLSLWAAPQASGLLRLRGGGARGVTQQEGQSWEQGTCSTGLVDLASDTCDLPAGWPHVPHRAE